MYWLLNRSIDFCLQFTAPVLMCVWLMCPPPSEGCTYKVAILPETTVSCFSKMKQETPCNKKHPNCITERRNGLICVKWFDTDLTCVDDELNEVSIGTYATVYSNSR